MNETKAAQRAPVTIISFIKLRDGVNHEQFADFAVTADLPTWRQKDVVLDFDTYRVGQGDPATGPIDFVEVMRVRSLEEWQAVANSDPDIPPLAARFAELVDESSVRRLHVSPVEHP